MQQYFFGIDFGTSTTAISHTKDTPSSAPQLIEIENNKIVETVLRVSPDAKQVEMIGSEAWVNAYDAPERTFFEFKEKIGSGEKYPIDGQSLTADGIGKLFLSRLREKIEQTIFNKKTLSEIARADKVTTVIGFPAEWKEVQKKATLQMASGAGFPNVFGCDEPLGAIYFHYYQGELDLDKEQYVLVYDFGGGATNTAIVAIKPGVDPRVHSVAVAPNLGGKHYDERISGDVAGGICMQTGNASLLQEDIVRIRRHCRQIKERLSLNIENRMDSAQETIQPLKCNNSDHLMTLSKDNFEKMHSDLLSDFAEPIWHVLGKASIQAKEISMVIVTGGSGKFYFVPEKLKKIFPDATFLRSINPQECIAKGLSLYAKIRACGREGVKPKIKSETNQLIQKVAKQKKSSIGKKRLNQNVQTTADGKGQSKPGINPVAHEAAKQKKSGVGNNILKSLKWMILTALFLLFVFVVLGIFWK
ncbi:MAG: Hsp70 family protein [Deltaproteobacteria bacterium]|nr:Hsp70 family protein [Deltaproteobacteria bacterium]